MTHALKKNSASEDSMAAMEEALTTQVNELETKADNNLNLGLAGGGIGGLLVGLVIPFVVMRRRGTK
jgi:tetrahydromethanopterin S-methyltransferase subunit F